MVESATPKLARLRELASQILDSRQSAYTLRPEVLEMTSLLADSQTALAPREEDIAAGETHTGHGLAVSPTMAEMCADDFVRTIQFIRGLHAAIGEARKRQPDRPARVLYAGCGPFATLAVPLMAALGPDEAVFKLVDVHPESLASARSIIEHLALTESATSFEAVDAVSYRVDPGAKPDVVLAEVMQACLAAEPQVAVTRHLLQQAPDAILVPEEVRIDLVLLDPAREFDLGGAEQNRPAVRRDRIPVSTVFVLNRQSAVSWEGLTSERLPAGVARLPETMDRRYQLMLLTTVRTHGEHVLEDYDSGLTCPRALSCRGDVAPGATIRFHYTLGRRPRLDAVVD